MIWVLALMGYSNLDSYMEDTYQIEGQPYFWLYFRAYSAEELQEQSPIWAFGTCIFWPWPTCQPCQMGCQVNRNSGDVETFFLSAKKVYDLIDGMFATLLQTAAHARSISGWTKPIGWFGALPHLNAGGSVLMPTLGARAGHCDKYGHCQMWEWHVLQTHVSRWPVRPRCGNSWLPRPSPKIV